MSITGAPYTNPDYWKNSGILQETRFQASLSGGKGGQNVNKVNTKAELYWSPAASMVVSEEIRERLLYKLNSKMNKEGEIRITCEEARSQLKNKTTAIDKLCDLLASCFKENKPRKASRPTKASVTRRLDEKKSRKDVKDGRKKIQ
ncbi:MAG: aminoacyl-tRNA hydrolase [Cytophagales bacterium]|nr:aminoacyl-tRNA hydrolase [Cytophaga sp.]